MYMQGRIGKWRLFIDEHRGCNETRCLRWAPVGGMLRKMSLFQLNNYWESVGYIYKYMIIYVHMYHIYDVLNII